MVESWETLGETGADGASVFVPAGVESDEYFILMTS